MKLEKKLLMSYLFVIVIAIMTSFTLFTFSSNQYLTYRIVADMEKELKMVQLDIQSNEFPFWPASGLIKNQLMKLVQSNLIIIQNNEIVYYDDEEILADITDNYLDSSYMDKKYITVNGRTDKGKNHYEIILLSEKGMITELNKINLSILFITSLVSMLIASFFGIYVQNNISRPIQELKNKVKVFKGNLIVPQRTVFTNDELEELDAGLVEMALSIENNDRKRKAFFENTSHELKTPLMNIRGYAEGLKDGIFTIDEAAEVISQESEVLKTMVEAILYLSKLEDATQDRFQYELIEINEFLTGFHHRMAGLVAEGELQFNLELDKSVKVTIDEDKMIRALSNIITNAIRYAKTEVKITTRIYNGLLEIAITNDGPQFSEKDLPHLFDRFYKGDKGQSGLGLAIVKSIINVHQGTVEAENTETGVSMTIKLPFVVETVKSKK